MTTEDNFPAILSRLDAKQSTATNKIEWAHTEVMYAETAVDDLERQLTQIHDEIQTETAPDLLARARRGSYDRLATIQVISESNPHRAGSRNHANFEKIKPGMTVE